MTRPLPEPDPVIEVDKKDVDRTLIRENLKLTHSQRVEKLIELQRFAEELRRAGDEHRKRERRERGRLPRAAPRATELKPAVRGARGILSRPTRGDPS